MNCILKKLFFFLIYKVIYTKEYTELKNNYTFLLSIMLSVNIYYSSKRPQEAFKYTGTFTLHGNHNNRIKEKDSLFLALTLYYTCRSTT